MCAGTAVSHNAGKWKTCTCCARPEDSGSWDTCGQAYFIALQPLSEEKWGIKGAAGIWKYKGISCSKSTKNKISIANKGKVGYWKNKHLSEKTRNKISKTRLERGIKGPINTSIITYLYKDNSLVKEFKSGAEIARYFGVSSAYINNCIKHNRLYKGFKIIQNNKGC